MKTHRCRVLIVDDHEQIRKTLRNVLSSYDDVDVIAEAQDGEEAIIRVASCQPEVILMDINMPRMNGIEATTVIMKSRKSVAIIGLCVVHDTYTVEAFLKAGGLAMVSKARLDDLHAMIQQACAARTSGPTTAFEQ